MFVKVIIALIFMCDRNNKNASTGSVTSLHPINWFAGALKTFTEEARPVVGKGGKLLH